MAIGSSAGQCSVGDQRVQKDLPLGQLTMQLWVALCKLHKASVKPECTL